MWRVMEKKRPHRGELLPFGAMTERWHLGCDWENVSTQKNGEVARKGDGLVIRLRAVKAMPEPTTMDDLDAMKGSPWAPSGVLKDILPDVPRPILSRDEPSVEPDEERPVPRNMKNHARHSEEVRIHARLCRMLEIVAK